MVSSKFLTSALTFLAIGIAHATNCRPSDSTTITQPTTSDASTLITITTTSSTSSEASTSAASTTSTSIVPPGPNWCATHDDCQDGCASGAFCTCISGICSEYF
ncbi:hypothetical protein CEP54_002158 [Fusarium duplospermum]|uniref:Uncharacterized protein n=1 Tax=Fusarium duplospermum TaxID=1325734 RepID=A0A428QWT9_9HYPO|nr:hypothetical protein CEP54_002158 [Fusarium duplospermum]